MEFEMFDFDSIVGFDWDEGNKQKNWEKHQVDYRECEEVFFNQPLLISEDVKHMSEKRYHILGRSDTGRALFLVFTIRNNNKVRITSARDQSKKERTIYEQQP